MIKNIQWIKIVNTRRAIDYACSVEQFSKRDMANALGICFTTASNIVNLLEASSILEGTVLPKNRAPGRDTKWYRLRGGAFVFLAVNFANKAAVTLALVGPRYEIEASECFVIPPNADWEWLAQQLWKAYSRLLSAANRSDENVVAVGVSVQGSYNGAMDILYSPEQPAVHRQHIRASFEELFGKTAVVGNDIDMAATYCARSRRRDNFMYVYLGNQIGIGIVNNGKLLVGRDGLTPEIAHAPLGDTEKVCPSCGAKGCLELSLGRGAFLERYFGSDFPIRVEGYEPEWNRFVQAVREGDSFALRVVEEKSELLTRMLVVALSITRISVIMIGGIPGELYAIIYPLVEKKIRDWSARYPVEEILFDDSAAKTILLGTMDAVYQRWYPDFENGCLWTVDKSREIAIGS